MQLLTKCEYIKKKCTPSSAILYRTVKYKNSNWQDVIANNEGS